MKVTITKLDGEFFSAVTDVPMSDGSFQSDSLMTIRDGALRSFEKPSFIRVGGLLKFKLGPVSLSGLRTFPTSGSLTFNLNK